MRTGRWIFPTRRWGFTREARKAVEDAALEAYFLRIARDLTSSFNDEGHHWPEMRAARPLWFQDKEEK